MATIRINQRGLQRLRRLETILSDAEFARLIGVDSATVSRVLGGVSAPGTKFIAGAVHAFGNVFHELFDVIDEESKR